MSCSTFDPVIKRARLRKLVCDGVAFLATSVAPVPRYGIELDAYREEQDRRKCLVSNIEFFTAPTAMRLSYTRFPSDR